MKNHENFLNTLKETDMIKDFKWIDDSDVEVIVPIDSIYLTRVNNLIIDYVNTTYGQFGVIYKQKNVMLTVDKKAYNSEYITKFVNNMTMYMNTIKRENIKDGDSFVNYIKTHLYDMFHYNSKYFKENYRTVTNTSTKGHRGEPAGLKYFSEFLNNTFQTEIKIDLPNSISEDINGIDGSFLWKCDEVTIQVKPFTTYTIENDQINVESNGALKLNANYLVLYKEKMRNIYDIIILKNGKQKDQIISSNSNFYTTKKNTIKIETDVLILP
jgi:hypothetical protein